MKFRFRTVQSDMFSRPFVVNPRPSEFNLTTPGFVRNKMPIMMEKRKTGSSKTLVSLKQPCRLSSSFRPNNTAHVRALEALLRNPVKFTPATERTKLDRYNMANLTSNRITKWKSDRDQREKRRRLVMRYLSKSWEPYMTSPAIRSFGLFNTGQTCYRNASIQVLMHLPIFLNWLEEYHHPNDCKTQGPCMACHMRRLKLAFWARYSGPTQRTAAVRKATDNINRNLRRMGWKEPEGQQHDSREFLLWILMTIRRQVPQDQIEILDGIFSFISDEEIECPNCNTSRFLAPKDVTRNPEFNMFTDLVDSKTGDKLINVIRRNFYTQREARCENPACGDKGNKTTREFITHAPEVLICPLKRFEGKWNPKKQRLDSSKDTTRIAFPETLDLSKFHGHPQQQLGGQLQYQLSSVVYHSGSLSGGHYISVAKGPDNIWRELNDQRVSDVEMWTALAYGGFQAYILTYTKQN